MISPLPLRLRHGFVLPVVAVMTTVVAGCSGYTPAEEQRDTEQSTSSPPATTYATPPEVVRATGTVVEGTQPGCLLLESVVKRYQLLGDKAAGLDAGQEVQVTGMVDPTIPSTCPNSIALTVSDVVPAT